MRLGDALNDCQAEADTRVAAVYAFGATPKRLDKGWNQLWGEFLASVLDSEHHSVGLKAGCDPHRALFRQVVDDGVVHEVRCHLLQERFRADGGGPVAGRFNGDAAHFCDREERLGGFFGYERQVEVFSGEGALLGAAEQEKSFSEVDRSGVEGAKAFIQLAVVTIRIVAGYLKKGLRDRQWSA
jgi:hypothetical protein